MLGVSRDPEPETLGSTRNSSAAKNGGKVLGAVRNVETGDNVTLIKSAVELVSSGALGLAAMIRNLRKKK